jgi:hypothetical protein
VEQRESPRRALHDASLPPGGETQFSRFLSFVNDVEYDTQSSVLGWQARFRWIVTPGTDIYVVYTHNWVEEPLLDRFATLDRRVASKVLYTYRL